MEIFQTIWTALSTPNPTLIYIFNVIGFPFTFIELTVTMLLFTTALNIQSTKKQKVSYVLVVFVISFISNTFIPKPYGTIFNVFLLPFIIMLFFKISLLKSFIAQVISIITIVLLESLFVSMYSKIFNVTYEIISVTPIYRESAILSIYLTIYLLYKIISILKVHVSLDALKHMKLKNKILLLITFIFALISMSIQFYLITFYIDKLPLGMTILSITTLIVYFIISLYSLIKTNTLENVTQDLEQTKLYNNTLQILHDNMRAFKHDFANIVQSIGRIYR